MIGQPERPVRRSSWGTETLRQYLLCVIDGVERRADLKFHELSIRIEQRIVLETSSVKTALESSDKAVAKSEAAIEKRFENVNEFRKSLSDLSATMITRSESEARLSALNARIDGLLNRVEVSEVRLDRKDGKNTGFANNIGLLVALLAIVLTIIGAMGFLRQDDTQHRPSGSVTAPATSTR